MHNPQKRPLSPVLTLIRDPRFEIYDGGDNKTPILIRDALAGLIVALVAIPLGVGFSMASGLGPEQGIIAGAVAGILGGLFGGSKYQVYGPTAAFIPLLSSMVLQYDVSFVILSSILGGFLIIGMGLLKLGNMFAKIPFSVTVGFTIGIAFSITLGQLMDVLGSLHPATPHTFEKIRLLWELIPHPNLATLGLAILSFVIIRYCYKTSVFIPGPLIAMLVAVLLSQTMLHHQNIPLVVNKFGNMDGSIFKTTLPAVGDYPWWVYIKPVLSIVFIASLESLLSARMADRLAGNKTPFNPNQELIGQGVVNMIVPLFNGFPCTGAFARTATSIKAGATSPVASLFKGSFVIVLMVFFAKYVSLIPMACIGGLLLYVAANMVKREEIRYVFEQGKLHLLLMIYTAVVTFLTDLFIAVSTATAFYYVFLFLQKRSLLRKFSILVPLGYLLMACPLSAWSATAPAEDPIQILAAGNKRFYKDHPMHPHQTHQQLIAVASEQHPFAVVIGCSDSRVPPEIIFDQGLGDIFDVRTAGNVLSPIILGSVEYAVEHLHVSLILVLGHEHCGAVEAAVHHEKPHNHVNSIIKALAPAVRQTRHQHGDWVENAVKENVVFVMHQITKDKALQKHIQSGQVKVIGGYYHLASGQVEFLTGTNVNLQSP